MSRSSDHSAVVTIRIPVALERRLTREARRRRRTRSETARALLEKALADRPADDPVADARRQSLLASRRRSERQAIEFIAAAADLTGWR
jgi:hypothetical protein